MKKFLIIGLEKEDAFAYGKVFNLLNIPFGIYDENSGLTSQVCQQYGGICFNSLHKALNFCDIALLAVNEDKTIDYVNDMKDKVKEVIIVPPTAESLEMINRLQQIEKEYDIKISLAYDSNFNVAVSRIQELSKEVGEITAVRVKHLRKGSIYKDKSCIQYGENIFSAVDKIVNKEVKNLYSDIGNYFGLKNEDRAILMLNGEGVDISMDLSFSLPDSYPQNEKLDIQVIGTKGVLETEAYAQNINLYSNLSKDGEDTFFGTEKKVNLIESYLNGENIGSLNQAEKFYKLLPYVYESSKKEEDITILP